MRNVIVPMQQQDGHRESAGIVSYVDECFVGVYSLGEKVSP